VIVMRRACIRWPCAIALGLLVWSRCAWALNPALDLSQYAHTAWKIRDGFPPGTIETVAQTPDGYLWLGTEFGLFRFDGIRNVRWQPPRDQHLPSDYITKLLAARDGALWIGTTKGLASWKNGSLTHYTELAGSGILSLIEDHEGSIWAGSVGFPRGDLCRIQKGSVRCYGDEVRFGVAITGLAEDARGNLWAGVRTGIWRWKPDPPKFIPLPGAAGQTSLGVGEDGGVLFGRFEGIRRLVEGKTAPYRLPGTSGEVDARGFLRDRDGGLWIAILGRGVVHVHQGRTDTFAQTDGLSGDSVLALFEDHEGNIWVSTSDGLDRFRDFAVTTFSANQGLRNVRSGGVLAAKDGSIWLGTANGLSKWNHGSVTIYGSRSDRSERTAQQLAVREIAGGFLNEPLGGLFQDGRGRIWVSTRAGVGYLERDRFITIGSVPDGFVTSMAMDLAENLWIANQDRGLLRLSPDHEVQRIPWATFGSKGHGMALAADPVQGGLWLGFYQGGVVYFRDGQLRSSYSRADGLAEGRVNDLRFDREGALWVATDGGLSRLTKGRIATLSSKNGLPCDAVQWTMEDDAESFWLKMPCGLVRVARSGLDAWAAAADKAGRTIPTRVFDSSDGVRSLADLGTYTPHAAKSPDGRLWFTTPDGLSVIDPRHIPFNKVPPTVHVEQVIADRKTYAADVQRRLPPLTRDLEIEYTALSLMAPEKMRFRYKLEGYDRDWQEAGTRRQAFYNELPPRNYRFRVMASNNNGVWNEAGASFDFSIEPAYYQTTWFRSVFVAVLLALLAALYRLRLLYLNRQFAIRLDARVQERMRIARDLHDTLLQSFQGVVLKFHAVTYRLPDRPEAKKELEAAIEQARQALAEGRDAVQGLRSSVVVTNDLARAITTFGEGLACDQDGRHAPEFHVVVEGTSRDLAPLVRDEVYRIAGEALRNAFRHAEARRIEVEIHYDTRRLRMRVRDDGKGIDQRLMDQGGRAGHHGLPGMHERARLVGGKLAIWSELHSGTEIELSIPAAVAYGETPVSARKATG
jgi:signal transduction histidine kinase/ligand-binding sensor domain-containing protein